MIPVDTLYERALSSLAVDPDTIRMVVRVHFQFPTVEGDSHVQSVRWNLPLLVVTTRGVVYLRPQFDSQQRDEFFRNYLLTQFIGAWVYFFEEIHHQESVERLERLDRMVDQVSPLLPRLLDPITIQDHLTRPLDDPVLHRALRMLETMIRTVPGRYEHPTEPGWEALDGWLGAYHHVPTHRFSIHPP